MSGLFQAFTLLAIFCGLVAAAGRFPSGPNQQCTDDAGPPWMDDSNIAYYVGFAAEPKLGADGTCPGPLAGACAEKGALAAFHDGPVDCGDRGWFCILEDQPGHRAPGMKNGRFPDSNFAFCAQKDSEHDRDGHCHGSDADNTYGWWVRDHWHRNYAGKIRCCCGWASSSMRGYVNRCDYRKEIKSQALRRKCRDANEEHNVDWNPGCDMARSVPPPETCWEMQGFGPAKLDGDGGGGGNNDDENDGGNNDNNDNDGDNKNAKFCARAKKARKCKKRRKRCRWERRRCVAK